MIRKAKFFGRAESSRRAFTLVEMLVVITVIAILMGMVGFATTSARQSSYRARAQMEIREISNALKAYWITYGYWPPEIESSWSGEKTPIEMTGKMLESLRGKGNPDGKTPGENTRQIVFLDLSDKQMRDNAFVDPWGTPYQIYLSKRSDAELPKQEFYFYTAVTFPMRDRYLK